MTKVGEGEKVPKPTVEQYHKDVDASSLKFLNALGSYNNGEGLTSEEKSHLKVIMDQQLEIIRAAVKELKRAGIYKQEVKVENDYKEYMNKGTPESFAALEHDLTTLRDYNQLP
ncbi:MAG TPA: hypothetical protein VLE89_04110 [Chlamydiales bacterium]|nr:hypothetical protein [Chlamydiales bacterium]